MPGIWIRQTPAESIEPEAETRLRTLNAGFSGRRRIAMRSPHGRKGTSGRPASGSADCADELNSPNSDRGSFAEDSSRSLNWNEGGMLRLNGRPARGCGHGLQQSHWFTRKSEVLAPVFRCNNLSPASDSVFLASARGIGPTGLPNGRPVFFQLVLAEVVCPVVTRDNNSN